MELRIKEISKQKKIPLKTVAEHLEVTTTQVSNYISGKSLIPLDKLKKVAEVLDCEVLELLHPSEDFAHFYSKRGEWWGIRKK